MKLSEKIWVEKLALASLARPRQEKNNSAAVQQFMLIFLEELCYLVVEYITYFNDIVTDTHICPDESHAWSLFKLTQPRTGLIATRGKDKLVIAGEGNSIHIKMVQSYLQNERLHESLFFDPKVSDFGTVNWRCANDGQYVNPELVAKSYLSNFFVSGCKDKVYPKLTAVNGGQVAVKNSRGLS
ncbi:MAG: hypothetical protein V4591_05235 [Bdellovibrionota bacterium]